MEIFLKLFTKFRRIIWRYRFFAYLCKGFNLELFKFSSLTFKKYKIMTKKYICLVCGYIHEGETAPEECPLCFVGPEDFKELTEDEA